MKLMIAVLLLLMAFACAPEASAPETSPTASAREAQPTPAAPEALQVTEEQDGRQPPARPDRVPLIKGPRSKDGLQAILGTADLGVGRSRIGFVLTSPRGFVAEPDVQITSRLASSNEVRQTVEARFQPWPYGTRGLYAAFLDFDVPGEWTIDIAVNGDDGPVGNAELTFPVHDSPLTPRVGDMAVTSVTRTVVDVESLAELTTGSLQDPDLYQTSLAEAVSSGVPTVVVFASPAFCTNEVCGPQVDVLQALKNEYKGKANFVHVDFYDNPDEIQGDLDKARISPAVLEWKLPSIEWTFVVDGQGTVISRFEGFATYDEVEEALRRVL